MISVIIPHLEQEAFLARCLASLRSQEDVKGSVELIVVDNGSRRPPTEICARHDALLLVQPIPGPGPARNLGASKARGACLAFIDADCIAGPRWLSEIELCFRENPHIRIIGGDVRIACDDPNRLTWLEAYESVFAYRMKEYIRTQGFTGTGNLAMRASIFDAVGPFGGIEIAEDRDWGQRALALGYRTHYRPTMLAYHPARKSFSELAEKWRRHTAHDFKAVRSKASWWPRWMLRTMMVAVSPVAEIARIGFSDRVLGVRAKFLAFYGVVVIRAFRVSMMWSLAFGSQSSQSVARWNRA